MAQYRVTSPDGAEYEITAPDDATPEQVQRFAMQQFQSAPPQPAQAPQSFTDRLLQAAKPEMGILRGARDVVDAGAQMLVRGAAAANLAPQSEVKRVDQINRDAEKQYQQGRSDGQGFDALRLVGNVLATSPVFAGVPAGTGLAAKTALGAVSGAGYGAMQPVENPGQDFWTQKAQQAKTGAISGAIAAPITAGLTRIIQPKTSPDVKALLREGITPTPGQVLGGGFRSAEEKAKSIPILGSSIRNAEQRGTEQLNAAAVNRSLTPIGKELPKGTTGREAVQFAEDALKQSYDDVLTKIGAPKVDNQMLGELANLRNIVANQPKDFAGRLDKIIDNEILGRTQNGRLTGEAVKAAEGNLGELARGLRKNPDYDTRKLGEAVDETQRILRSWLERTAPKDVSAQLKATNQGWANFKRVQRAASSVAAEDGVFSAAQLQSAVKALDRSKDKGAFARGNALMQDLSGPAKNVLANKVPNSGTTDRALAALGLAAPLAGTAVTPWLAAGAIPAALYTKPGQAAMAGLLARRPELAEPVSEAVRAVGAPVLTGGLFGLLGQ